MKGFALGRSVTVADCAASVPRGAASGTARRGRQEHGAPAMDELSVQEDRDRIGAALNEVVVRRLYSAGLSLQGALALVDGHQAHRKIQEALDELDQSIADIRDAVFGSRQPASPDGSPPGENPQP